MKKRRCQRWVSLWAILLLVLAVIAQINRVGWLGECVAVLFIVTTLVMLGVFFDAGQHP